MLSGGGTRAAALGYGVLEQLQQQKVTIGGKSKSLMSNVDLVVGVSGGSVLAAYFALKGEETIPLFYKRFLHQNFQRQVVKQAFSMSNLPRLASNTDAAICYRSNLKTTFSAKPLSEIWKKMLKARLPSFPPPIWA